MGAELATKGVSWAIEIGKLIVESRRLSAEARKALDRRLESIQALGDLLAEIRRAAGREPHGVILKDRWSARLQKFAEDEAVWLGPLRHCCDGVARKLEDHSFDHGQADSEEYCCDELLLDLNLLELEAYERLATEAQVDGEKLREIQEEAFASFGPWLEPGSVGKFVPAGQDVSEEQAVESKRRFNDWKVGLLRLPEKLAMYRYYSRQGFGEKGVT